MRNTSFVRHSFLRCLVLTLTVLVITATAQAYTIVLRNGRVIEIPKTFSVSPPTITYEVNPGFQVTLQIAAIDTIATDLANREPIGSFNALLKANQSQTPATATVTNTARRTITNRDLAAYANIRRASERAYEKRRKELGLPSNEESRRRAAEENEALRNRMDRTLSEDSKTEAYWRERATNLQADMASVSAEISSVRDQLDSLPQPNTLNAFSSGYSSILPYGVYNPYGVNPILQTSGYPAPVVQYNRSFRNRYLGFPFGLQSIYGNQFPYYPNFGVGYQPYDMSYERSALSIRLHELVSQQAALQARWRALEEQARRAGAYPGWLRP